MATVSGDANPVAVSPVPVANGTGTHRANAVSTVSSATSATASQTYNAVAQQVVVTSTESASLRTTTWSVTWAPIARTWNGNLTAEIGQMPVMDGVTISVSTLAHAIYRPPVILPPLPVIEPIIPADPVAVDGYVVRPLFGMLADPDNAPTIIEGRPT